MSRNDVDSARLRFADFELDEANARLARAGVPVVVAPKAFAVLCALARQPGQLVTKNSLLDAVWGHQHVSESVLKTIISELRAALQDDARQPRYIETVSRRGYRFVAGVSVPPAVPRAGGSSASGQTRAAPLMVGRQAALERLRNAWLQAHAGQRRVLWIAGEAGIGKTTLIDSFLAEVGDSGVARGQCVEQFGPGEPYLPVLEALGALCRDDPALVSMLRSVAPTWMAQLPWLTGAADRDALQRELAGASQDRMLREMGELLERHARHSPLLLVTEDLHWSDQATLRLIDHVARRRGSARFLWLASYRLAEVIAHDHPLKSLRSELRLHNLCEEIVLDPFSEREIADYIEQRFPDVQAPEAAVRALHARTDGLPLFVASLVSELVAQSPFDATSRSLGDVPTQVPENLAGVIETQISRLPREVQDLLEAASVCGIEFRPTIAARVLERDPASVGAHCEALARQQLWLRGLALDQLPDGTLDARYEFRHAIYRQVFYDRIGALTRAQRHRRVAQALEQSRAAGAVVSEAELASHYELGHDLMSALEHYTAAADSASRRFAPQEALDLTTRALAIAARCPQSAERDGWQLALRAMQSVACAQLFGVSSPRTKSAWEGAAASLEVLPQHPLRGMVLYGLGLVLMTRGEYAEGTALGARMQALSASTGDPIPLICACSILGQLKALQGEYAEALAMLERGIASCLAVGEAALRATFIVDPLVAMYAASALPLISLGRVRAALAQLDAARARAQLYGQPMATVIANWYGAIVGVRMFDPERVAAHAGAIKEVVERASLAQGKAPAEWFRGWVEVHRGSPEEGCERIRAAHAYSVGLGMYGGAAEIIAYTAEARAVLEDWSGAQALLAEAMQLADRLGERVYLPQMLCLRAQIEHARGQAESSRESMLESLSEARAQCAPWLELGTLVALCKLDGAGDEHFALLRDVRARLSEGAGTPLAARADALLRASAASPAGR